jgi:hypothetical protein
MLGKQYEGQVDALPEPGTSESIDMGCACEEVYGFITDTSYLEVTEDLSGKNHFWDTRGCSVHGK